MGRYAGPVVKVARRLGINIAETEKVQKYLDRRPYSPGQHGQKKTRRPSDYAVRLREKQKLRRIYGIYETQFKTYFRRAAQAKGVTGVRLLQLLETRLDNVVYRLGYATSRREARQMVLHGHIGVNGRKVTVPSYQLKPGDVVAPTPHGKEHPRVKELAATGLRTLPSWLEFTPERLEGRVLALPAREEIDVPVQEQLIVEYYSR